LIKQTKETMIDYQLIRSLQVYSTEIAEAIHEAKQANDDLTELLGVAEDNQDKESIRLAKLHVILYSDIAKKHAEMLSDAIKYAKDKLPSDCRYAKRDNTCVMGIDCECVLKNE